MVSGFADAAGTLALKVFGFPEVDDTFALCVCEDMADDTLAIMSLRWLKRMIIATAITSRIKVTFKYLRTRHLFLVPELRACFESMDFARDGYAGGAAESASIFFRAFRIELNFAFLELEPRCKREALRNSLICHQILPAALPEVRLNHQWHQKRYPIIRQLIKCGISKESFS
jgi:hypothetical protein